MLYPLIMTSLPIKVRRVLRLTESKWANIKNGPGTENELEGKQTSRGTKGVEKKGKLRQTSKTETKEVFNNDHTKENALLANRAGTGYPMAA